MEDEKKTSKKHIKTKVKNISKSSFQSFTCQRMIPGHIFILQSCLSSFNGFPLFLIFSFIQDGGFAPRGRKKNRSRSDHKEQIRIRSQRKTCSIYIWIFNIVFFLENFSTLRSYRSDMTGSLQHDYSNIQTGPSIHSANSVVSYKQGCGSGWSTPGSDLFDETGSGLYVEHRSNHLEAERLYREKKCIVSGSRLFWLDPDFLISRIGSG